MVPTFLQKRLAKGHSLRRGLLLAALVGLFIGCVVTFTMILVDRDMTTLDKEFLISGILLGLLLGGGLITWARR